jgi:hypothetical protein
MPDLSLSVTAGQGLASGRRVVERWWATHALDAVLWTLAGALAVVVGLVVARL